MHSAVFHNLLFGDLRPWRCKFGDLQRATELIRASELIETSSCKGLQDKLHILLQDYKETARQLKTERPLPAEDVAPFHYELALPKFYDIPSRFFQTIIVTERARFFNSLVVETARLSREGDIRYTVRKAMRYLSTEAIYCKEELDRLGYNQSPARGADHVHFALYRLKLTLFVMYFDVQKCYERYLTHVDTEEDYFQLVLREMAPETPLLTISETLEKPAKSAKDAKKFSFGFIGDKTKLKSVINELCREVELLDQERTSQSVMFDALAAIRLPKDGSPIYLNCDTKQFRYIIDRFSHFFNNLTPTTVEESGLFYSKNDTLLKAQNLHASKQQGPKKKEVIDRIFQEML